MRRAIVLLTAVVFAVVGPRLTAPHDRAAGEPFSYEPPEGFTAPDGKEAATAVLAPKDDEREWVHALTPGHVVAPRLHLKQSNVKGTVEPADLAKIAEGMPAMLQESGVTWTDVRLETRTRPDGTRVGLIEGECTKKVEDTPAPDFAAAAPRQGASIKVQYRRLLFVFPTDEGSAFTTAVYGKDEIAKWQPELEATIAKARGVALRVPPPPGWMYFAWGAAGLVLGWLAVSLVEKRGAKAEAKAEEPPPASKPPASKPPESKP